MQQKESSQKHHNQYTPKDELVKNQKGQQSKASMTESASSKQKSASSQQKSKSKK